MSIYKHTHSHLKDKQTNENHFQVGTMVDGWVGVLESLLSVYFLHIILIFEPDKYFTYLKIKYEYTHLHINIHLWESGFLVTS